MENNNVYEILFDRMFILNQKGYTRPSVSIPSYWDYLEDESAVIQMEFTSFYLFKCIPDEFEVKTNETGTGMILEKSLVTEQEPELSFMEYENRVLKVLADLNCWIEDLQDTMRQVG